MRKIISLVGCFFIGEVSAQEALEVGKHVAGNMDAMSMILSLLMVLAIIVLFAFILKKFQPGLKQAQGLKIVTSLHLGTKERLIVVQVEDKQLLLGVTAHQITVLDTLDENLKVSAPLSTDISQSIVSLLSGKNKLSTLNQPNTSKTNNE